MLCLEFHCAVTAVTRQNQQLGDLCAERPCEARCGPVCAFPPGGGNAVPGARNRRLSPPRSGCFSDRAFCRIPGLSAPGRWVDSQAGESAGSLPPARTTPPGRADRKNPEKSGLFRPACWVCTGRNLGVVTFDNSGNRSQNGKKARVFPKFSGVAEFEPQYKHNFQNQHKRGNHHVLIYHNET